MLVRRRRYPSADTSGRIIPLVIAFGLALAAANYTYYAAIARLPVAIAIVIQYTAPALVVMWKALVERRRPSSRVLAALGLATIGVIMVSESFRALSGNSSRLSTAGVAIALASALGFATYVLIGEKVEKRMGSERSVLAGFVVAGIFWAIVLASQGRPDTLLNRSFIPGILFLGIATTIAPFLLFLWGLGIVSASPAGIISTLEPVSGAVLAYLWLGQALSWAQIAGAVAVIIGISVLQSQKRRET